MTTKILEIFGKSPHPNNVVESVKITAEIVITDGRFFSHPSLNDFVDSFINHSMSKVAEQIGTAWDGVTVKRTIKD